MPPSLPAREAEKPLALAEAAHTMVQADAVQAAGMAEEALGLARAARDREAEVAALHALGFARRELGDDRTVATVRAAVRAGERYGFAQRTALARRLLAGCLAYAGAIGPALREVDAACASLDGIELARSEVFRIGVLGLAGQAPATLTSSNRALLMLRRAGDSLWEARLLKNRGLLLAERGDVSAAEPDLIRARDLYAELGATEAAFGAEIALARVGLVRGDLPSCLARLDAVRPSAVPAPQLAGLELLRAQALIAARLMGEARHALASAQPVWRRAGIADPEARLELIRLTLHAGDPLGARALADRARRSFAASRRYVYCARAIGLSLAASIAAGAVARSAIGSGRRAADTLAAAGWQDEAQRVRMLVARAAIELGSLTVARRELTACSPLPRRGPVADRVEGWHVEALLRLRVGDEAAAERALRSGLRLLDAYRAALGAADLRASVSAIGVELAALGLRIALAGGNVRHTLVWAEMLRASALQSPPVTPPESVQLREQATELRRLSLEIGRAERRGRSARSLVAEQAALEASIRRTARHQTAPVARAATVVPTTQIATALGADALIEFVALDGALTAVTQVGMRLARHDLGAVSPVQEELEWLRFALARTMRRGPTSTQTAALARTNASAAALDSMLIAPLAPLLGDRGLVIVPTGTLHELPWAILPSLRGRPVVVAPSAGTWIARNARPRHPRRKVVLVAGPRLRHASAEVADVRALYGRATVLTGRDATVAAVMRALDGATVAHLACHGHFRSDSPLFSSLELTDGSLNAYEVQRLRRPPDLVVLSACDLAVSGAHPGDELLGFAAALLGMGARTVIASVAPVPDAAARRLMIAAHRGVASGRSPAVALARAQAALRPREAALAAFVCLGAGSA